MPGKMFSCLSLEEGDSPLFMVEVRVSSMFWTSKLPVTCYGPPPPIIGQNESQSILYYFPYCTNVGLFQIINSHFEHDLIIYYDIR